MPSKLYGILASASPVLAVVPKDCELASIVSSAQVGDVVSGDDPEKVGQAILALFNRRDQLAGMGQRARRLAVEKYDRPIQTERFAAMLAQLSPAGDRPAPPTPPRGDASPVGANR
jgi:colanic acid biosynthesis glycosyl transferase WcaI